MPAMKLPSSSLPNIDEYLFVEQAEYIEDEWLIQRSAEHPNEEEIIRKLVLGGAKLITGPRGAGKTTLMKKAYYKMMYAPNSLAYPVYVNFKSSLKLEPLYTNNANAVFWFNQWLILKIYDGVYETLERLDETANNELTISRKEVKRRVAQLEQGRVSLDNSVAEVSTESLEKDILRIIHEREMTRCILLLDDAAHAFSPQQQRDFFDFFRQIKSRDISPKAAIYPGVTTYSPTFHVGHDAEEIDIWIRPDAPDYIEFMITLLERRLPTRMFENINDNRSLLELICFAAYGLPRLLLNMIRRFETETTEDNMLSAEGAKLERKSGLLAIKDAIDTSYSLYSSLQVKLPVYENYILTGEKIFDRMIAKIKDFNRNRNAHDQAVEIAIKRSVGADLDRVLRFLQYAGLVSPKGVFSRGEKGSFEVYSMHYAALIERNALLARKSVNVAEFVAAFSRRPHQTYPRVTPEVLLGNDVSSFVLSLPPCKVCNTPRTNVAAKFCTNCAAPLTTASVYEELINQEIDQLPLTKKRISRIRQHSNIKRVKDVLFDHENAELRKVPYIGPVWAQRIFAYAEEFIG